MTTYYFQPVRTVAVKRLPCPGCGKKIRRQRTFQQTISPYNRAPDGTPKSPREVQASVRAQADAWEAIPETCPPCEAKQRAGEPR